MEYVIYNKNTPVFSFEMIHNKIIKIIEIYNPKYRPVQVKYNNKKNIIEKSSFEHFLKGRRIPDTRQDKDIILKNIQGKSLYELSLAYFGLSLSDQYWIKEKNDSVEWKDINFFQNDFSQDMGLFMFGKSDSSFSLKTPNNTSDGWLKKAWMLNEEKRILIKGSSKPFYQEAFNEKIAYEISKILGINHIKYETKNIGEVTCSVCENFIDENTELVPVNAIVQNVQKPNHISMYDFVIEELEKLGVNDAKKRIDEMLFLDYIIFNEDRHFNNFGFIRDVETLEVIGMAPIYDSGTSLFYNTLDTAIKSYNPDVKPFFSDRHRQFELIKDSIDKKVDTDKIQKIIVNVLSQSSYLEEFAPERKNIIADKVAKSL
ncbi:MAG: HipA domain-containing protein [Finegoldia magna]|nr:HipA domain-containing protein [Finegoldia magna]